MLLVFLTCVYHDARFREYKDYAFVRVTDIV